MAKIDVLLNVMVQHEASDLHISAGTPPMLRIDGELQRTKYHDLSPEEVENRKQYSHRLCSLNSQ